MEEVQLRENDEEMEKPEGEEKEEEPKEGIEANEPKPTSLAEEMANYYLEGNSEGMIQNV
jgi:hypothetical protein